MRLLHTTTYQLTTFFDSLVPPYVILSHTWGTEEVSFQDIASLPTASLLSGFRKIKLSCTQAAKDGFEWIWIDTCCIDKTSSAELSEAINSMFKWYEKSAICYAFLEDVDLQNEWEDGFRKSRWFTRGWTLQELIAPKTVEFYDLAWNEIGTKRTLQSQIAAISGVNYATLGGQSLGKRCIAERMSWAAQRHTTREEDEAYCLMGIFDVNMPMLYGEGGYKAFLRLQEAVMKISDDYSLFAWRHSNKDNQALSGMLSVSPTKFLVSSEEPEIYSGLVPDVHLLLLSLAMRKLRIVNQQMESAPILTSKGLDITLARGINDSLEWGTDLSLRDTNKYFVYLNCRRSDNHMLCIYLVQSPDPFTYARVQTTKLVFVHPKKYNSFIPTRMYVWPMHPTSFSYPRHIRGANHERVQVDYHIRIDPTTASDITIHWLYTRHIWDSELGVVRSINHDWQHNVSMPAAVFECWRGSAPIFRVAFGIKSPDNEPWCSVYAREEAFDDATYQMDFESYGQLLKEKDEILNDRGTAYIPTGSVLVSIRKRPSKSPDQSLWELGLTRVFHIGISLRRTDMVP